MADPGLILGQSETGRLIREFDWSATPLGPIDGWPISLTSILSVCLHSSFPMAVYWGPELRLIYNEAWSEIVAEHHPAALGQPVRHVMPELWPTIGPPLEEVAATGRGWVARDRMLRMRRGKRIEETYWDFSISPIVGENGAVAGLLNEGRETTERVLAIPRTQLLGAFDERARVARHPTEVIDAALELAAEHFGAGRIGYATIDRSASLFSIERCRVADGMADLTGTYALGAFGDALHLSMLEGQPFVIEDVATDPRLEGEGRARYRAIGIGSGTVVPIIQQDAYVAALFVHDRDARAWPQHQVDTVRRLAERLRQEVDRLRAVLALRDSEERYRLIFEQAQDMIFTADLGQRITAANPAAAAAIGLSPHGAIGRSIGEFLDPEDAVRAQQMLQHKLAGGGTTQYEVRLNRPSGEQVLLEVNSTLACDDDGRPRGLHGIARDITKRHAFEQSQSRLIDELNHRVKNTLALVQGLAMQSFRPDREPAEAQEVFQNRLATLASAHDLLTRTEWQGATLSALVDAALAVHDEPRGRLARGGPALTLSPKAAISLILVLHELATNAAKFGALSAPRGTIAFSWSIEDGILALDWREAGGPPVEAPRRRGFGLRMIERTLANDLSANVTMDFAEEGFHLAVHAPEEKINA